MPVAFRHRLAMFVGGLALAVALPAYWYIDGVHARQLIEDRYQGLQDVANAVAILVAENLNERQREIELLAQSPLLREADLDDPAVRLAIERLQQSYPHYSWLGLADPQGIVQAASGNLLVGVSVAQRPWFSAGLRGPFIGDLHEALLLSKLLPQEADEGPIRFIDFTAPVLDADGQVRGVLASHAHWRWAASVIDAIRPLRAERDGIEVFLVNSKGVVVYPEDPDLPAEIPEAVADPQARFLDWQDGVYLTASAPVREIIPEQPEPLQWRVAVRQPQAQVMSNVRDLQRVIVVAAVVSALLFLVLAWWLAARLSQPLEKLARVARRIEAGDENPRFEIQARSAEVSELVQAIRGMTRTLLQRKQALEASNLSLEATVEERTQALKLANAELTDLARRDTLTGLPNRRAIDERLRSDYARFQRYGTPYAVIVLDIDHFKRINDTYGHASGDLVLRELAGVCTALLRKTDLVGRQGGEEFLIVLALEDGDQVLGVAEAVRNAIAEHVFHEVGSVTVSLGVSVADPADPDPEAIVKRADERLYAAKRGGRNRVES